jgi:hypothetical protein
MKDVKRLRIRSSGLRPKRVRQRNQEIIVDWHNPELRTVPDDKTRAWLTPVAVLSVLSALILGYWKNGASGAEHVWTVAGPLLAGVLSHYYCNERSKNSKHRRELS